MEINIKQTIEKQYLKNYIYNIKQMMCYLFNTDKEFYYYIRYKTPKVIWDIVYLNKIDSADVERVKNITNSIKDIREDNYEILINYYVSLVWEYVAQYILNKQGLEVVRNGEDKDPTKNKGFYLEADLISTKNGEKFEITHQNLDRKEIYIKKYKLDHYAKDNTNMLFITFSGTSITYLIIKAQDLKKDAKMIKMVFNKQNYVINNTYKIYNI